MENTFSNNIYTVTPEWLKTNVYLSTTVHQIHQIYNQSAKCIHQNLPKYKWFA